MPQKLRLRALAGFFGRVPLHLLVVHAVAISHDLRGAFSGVLVLLAGARALVLDGLHLHFQRLRFFRGQNALTVTEVVVRHGEDGFIIRHVADDTRHIRKSGKLACPLAAVASDDLIAAILTGTHQRRLIDARRLDRLHKPLHLRIVPDAKGVIFERVQIGQVEIDDFFFERSSGVTGRGRLRRDLRTGRSTTLIRDRLLRGGLALGLFVPRFGRLGLVESSLAILGRTASARFGGLVL